MCIVLLVLCDVVTVVGVVCLCVCVLVFVKHVMFGWLLVVVGCVFVEVLWC